MLKKVCLLSVLLAVIHPGPPPYAATMEDPVNQFQRGVAFYRQAQYAEAKTAFKAYLSQNPDHRPTKQWLTLIDMRLSSQGSPQFMMEQIPRPPMPPPAIPPAAVQPPAAIENPAPDDQALSPLRERAEAAEAALKEARQKLALRDEQVKRALEQTRRALAQAEETEALKKAFDEKLAELQRENERLNKSRPAESGAEAEKTVQTQKKEIRRLETELRIALDEIGDLRERLNTDTTGLKDLKERLAGREEVLARMEKELWDTRHALEEEQKTRALREAAFEDEHDRRAGHVAELENDLEAMRLQLEEAHITSAGLREDLQEREQQIHRAMEQTRTVLQKLEKHKERSAELQSALDAERADHERLKDANDAQTEEIARLHARHGEAQRVLREQVEAESMQEKMALINKVSTLRDEQAATETRMRELEETLAETKKVLKEISVAYQVSENDRLEARRELARLTKNNYDLNTLNRNLLTSSAEARIELKNRLDTTVPRLQAVSSLLDEIQRSFVD